MNEDFRILLFYKYITLENPEEVASFIRNLCRELDLKGRILVAEEGINGTLEGIKENTEKFIDEFHKRSEFSDVYVKSTIGIGDAFPKLSVKVREEIVGTKFSKEEADPRVKTAPRLSAEELRDWFLKDEDFVIVDMRNDYEYESGHFKKSINPGLKNSRDLKEKLKELETVKNKKVVTVCTGGIRCEKMSALLVNKGFEEVYQLQDGIHDYMEKFPGEDYLGTLYTFDKRVTMDFGGNREIIGKCKMCGEKTERYENCTNLSCHIHFLTCDSCVEKNGLPFCSENCKEKVLGLTIN